MTSCETQLDGDVPDQTHEKRISRGVDEVRSSLSEHAVHVGTVGDHEVEGIGDHDQETDGFDDAKTTGILNRSTFARLGDRRRRR